MRPSFSRTRTSRRRIVGALVQSFRDADAALRIRTVATACAGAGWLTAAAASARSVIIGPA